MFHVKRAELRASIVHDSRDGMRECVHRRSPQQTLVRHGHFRATALRDDHHGVHRTDDDNCISLGAVRHNNRGRENLPLIAGSNGDNNRQRSSF